ncbi:hypothetical protein PV433_22465 [Paenibacillus sp. GYB004]|uniref:hypothetical protein n=1 Tax=Paenibacillus sp. GYB004 TaxID=2994393 RepID=UPI002F968A4C
MAKRVQTRQRVEIRGANRFYVSPSSRYAENKGCQHLFFLCRQARIRLRLGEKAERSRLAGKLTFTQGMCDAAKVSNKK